MDYVLAEDLLVRWEGQIFIKAHELRRYIPRKFFVAYRVREGLLVSFLFLSAPSHRGEKKERKEKLLKHLRNFSRISIDLVFK